MSLFCHAPRGKCVHAGGCYATKQCQYEPADEGEGILYGDGMQNPPAGTRGPFSPADPNPLFQNDWRQKTPAEILADIKRFAEWARNGN